MVKVFKARPNIPKWNWPIWPRFHNNQMPILLHDQFIKNACKDLYIYIYIYI